jgi:hypothetical protein
MHMRDDFSYRVKELLAKRVGYRCSNPDCRQVTSGPQVDPTSSINVGVAAHITAASPRGPRYDRSLTFDERRDSSNGIRLCQKCAKLVDSDSKRYTVEKLVSWKNLAEKSALDELEGRSGPFSEIKEDPFLKLETLIPKLLAEMREDLGKFPLKREFVLLKKNWACSSNGIELVYYYDDHTDLRNKIRILENYGLVEDITYTNVDRFLITEEFANYLTVNKNFTKLLSI